MTGHHESTGPDSALSSDSLHRVTQYQTAGVNARLKVFALLEAHGVPASEADDLVAALEAGAVAGAQCQVVELSGMAPASRGSLFSDGWDDGVTAVSEAMVSIADRDWSRRDGRSVVSAELAVYVADVRQRERADLVRLERFVRENVLPRTHPHTTARRVLEVLGEASGLCTARTRNADGDVIVCTLDAGHYDVDDKPPFKDGKPRGWHKADTSIWNDLGAACIPHAAL
ncbi:hypothetical protein [Streptomyces sp. DASNCL29]|uniref:hypothetical protein n=1 Tax=Streptomyces sp. DASNCL29 TaxID=2583819 RepID=UPI00110F8C0D|nr:hypothetical protein [Streptomyces sp. DASNCL29]TMV00094.1 hypothetical protein FGK60_22215 [Streptomyces sp. DASNCL29]